MTDFFHVKEPKSNILGLKSSNATALCLSTSSDSIAEPNIKTILLEPNLQIKSSDVAENTAIRKTKLPSCTKANLIAALFFLFIGVYQVTKMHFMMTEIQ